MRRGGLELAIMLAVAPGTRYGLEMIRHLQELTDLVVTEGTIYPILGRLHPGRVAPGRMAGLGRPSAELLPLDVPGPAAASPDDRRVARRSRPRLTGWWTKPTRRATHEPLS